MPTAASHSIIVLWPGTPPAPPQRVPTSEATATVTRNSGNSGNAIRHPPPSAPRQKKSAFAPQYKEVSMSRTSIQRRPPHPRQPAKNLPSRAMPMRRRACRAHHMPTTSLRQRQITASPRFRLLASCRYGSPGDTMYSGVVKLHDSARLRLSARRITPPASVSTPAHHAGRACATAPTSAQSRRRPAQPQNDGTKVATHTPQRSHGSLHGQRNARTHANRKSVTVIQRCRPQATRGESA